MLLGLLGVAAVLLAVAAAATLLAGPLLERQLQAWVEDQTGRDLHVEGGTRLSVWPAPGILIEGATLSGGSSRAGAPLIRIGELRLALRPGALFGGRFDVRFVEVRDARLIWAGGAGQGAIALRGVAASAAIETDGQSLILEPVELSAGAMRWAGGLRVSALGEAPVVTGRLRLAELDLRRWLHEQALPRLPVGDESTWRRLQGQVGVRAGAHGVTLDPVQCHVDQTKIAGRIRAQFSRVPQVRFDLELDRLDLGPYLVRRVAQAPADGAVSGAEASTGVGSGGAREPEAAGSVSPRDAYARSSTAAPTASGPSRGEEPGQPPGDIDVHGALDADELIVAGLRLAPAELSLTTEPQGLRLAYRSDGFYRGQLEGWMARDRHSGGLRLVASAKDADLGPLLQDLRDWSWLTGTAELAVDLTAADPGTGMAGWRERLDGELAIAVREGTVRGVDLAALIAGARAGAGGGALASARRAGLATPFAELTASASIEAGVLRNDDLAGRSDYLTLTGRGTADLVDERIDYRVRAVLVDPPQGRGLKELEGIPIPVRLRGPWSEPAWSVDLGPVLREVARRELDKDDGNLIRELEDRLGIEGIEEGLRGWLGR